MQSSPEAIYDKVYTSTDPWCETTEPDGTDAKGSMFSDAFRGLGHRHESDPVDIEVTVECTIAEFLMGSMKQINYQICQVQHDARTTKQVARSQAVQVNPGFSESTIVTYKGQGNEVIGKSPTNLIVKFKQIADKLWRRVGDDLILTHQVSFESALAMEPVKITTLDKQIRSLCFDEMIRPQTVRMVPGEGMPKTS